MPAIPLGQPLAGLVALPITTVLLRRYRPLQRGRRDAFHPPEDTGSPYRLSKMARRAASAALGPYRSRETAYRLLSFLARMWTHPERIGRSWPVDRRALASHSLLGLTEGEVRGALRVLEMAGVVVREPMAKRDVYRPTADGLRRTPIAYRFAPLFLSLFQAANRWKAIRERQKAHLVMRATATDPKANNSYSSWAKPLFMGSEKKAPEGRVLADPGSPLESALSKLREAILGG